MNKSLVIVESKTKAKTIGRYLGKGYEVMASNGHVVDLPKKELGVDINNGFEPKYITIPSKQKTLKELKAVASKVDTVYLAMDPDREGEAIAHFIADRLGLENKPHHRVLFYEITRKAIEEAMRNTHKIDERKVNAQQARRVLDRLVGYQVSPIIWKIIKPGLSAGRVQSVALRLICEREEEIDKFVAKEFWSIVARFATPRGDEFDAKLVKIDGENPEIPDETEANKLHDEIGNGPFVINTITRKERKRNTSAPFITSTLQQEASRRFGMSGSRTMRIAQSLYEGLEIGDEGSIGLITYMRTDSIRISDTALSEVRSFIQSNYEPGYLPSSPNVFKQKGKIQDAHEAIRPTSATRTPASVKKYLTLDQQKIYQLIWLRFVASQMTPAVYDVTTVDIPVGRFLLRANGAVIKFKGFLAVYAETIEEQDQKEEEGLLPLMEEGENLDLKVLTPLQHFTKPPPRFTEASLIKELETDGIGRPSTYASIMGTLISRTYVNAEKRRLIPTDLGKMVTKICVGGFPDFFNVGFTSAMESNLDSIERGLKSWQEVLGDFYTPFSAALEKGDERLQEMLLKESGNEGAVCDKCSSSMIVKWNMGGLFLGCSGYPACRNTKQINDGDGKDLAAGKSCQICGSDMEVRGGRYGSFLACAKYPECKFTQSLEDEPEPLDEDCDVCGSSMVIKTGRFGKFIACSKYPECKNTKPITLGIPCPREDCDGELSERRTKKQGRVFYGCAKYPKCDFAVWEKPFEVSCPECEFEYARIKRSRGRAKNKMICLKCEHETEVDE